MCFSTPSFPNRTVAVQKISPPLAPTNHISQPHLQEPKLHGRHHQTRRRPAEPGKRANLFLRGRSQPASSPATPATQLEIATEFFLPRTPHFRKAGAQKSIILSLLPRSISSPICEWLPIFLPFLHFAFRHHCIARSNACARSTTRIPLPRHALAIAIRLFPRNYPQGRRRHCTVATRLVQKLQLEARHCKAFCDLRSAIVLRLVNLRFTVFAPRKTTCDRPAISAPPNHRPAIFAPQETICDFRA